MDSLEHLLISIRSLVSLQNKLFRAFKTAFPQVTDWRLLLDAPKAGELQADGQTWSFQRHGTGLSFTSATGIKVDLHRSPAEPDTLDAWRLVQYMESSHDRVMPRMTEEDIEKSLRKLSYAGLLQECGSNRLYRLIG